MSATDKLGIFLCNPFFKAPQEDAVDTVRGVALDQVPAIGAVACVLGLGNGQESRYPNGQSLEHLLLSK